jgi:uncharacterized protein (UPF0548 family)
MFLTRRPSQIAIDKFIAAQRREKFSYLEVGRTGSTLPEGYTIDHNRVRIGRGLAAFDRAISDLRRWQMFNIGWLEIFPRNAPIAPHTTVALLVRHFGLWSLNACRIVYVIEQPRRFGFAYGTLREHAEQGEERFSIEWCEDDSIYYDILAFSKPRQWQSRLARPISRVLQKRFARDSMMAIVGAPPKETE